MTGRVVVVGAGLAGLTAALRLRQHGQEVVVLEAADRIGGRLLRQEIAGVPVDGGGAWVGPTQDRVHALLDELGLETVPTYDDGKHLSRLAGRIRTRSGSLPPLSALALADALVAQLRLDRLTRHVDGPRAAALDTRTIGEWIDRHVRTHGARTLIRIGVATTTGKDPADVSLLAFAAHVRSAGGLIQLLGVRGAAQDARIVGGAVSVCERLAATLEPGSLRLESPVLGIDQSEAGVRVRRAKGDVDADAVVVAIDPARCRTIEFGTALPSDRRRLQERWSMGSGIKFHIAYERPFWRTAGLSGQFLADDGLVRITFDATPDPDGRGVLVGFLGEPFADEPRLLAPAARETRAERVADELSRVFGPEAARPLDYVEQDWRAEQFLDGCVPALPTGVLSVAGDAASKPWARVHWAGAESSEIWEGHMDGAVRSAERAATAIAASPA